MLTVSLNKMFCLLAVRCDILIKTNFDIFFKFSGENENKKENVQLFKLNNIYININ